MTVTNSNAIIQSPEPKGHFKEGVLAAGQTPYPGMQAKLNSDGTWSAWTSSADGDKDEVILFVENHLEGGSSATRYVDGAHCYMYIPVMGDECMVLLKDVSGTGDAHLTGELLMADHLTGKYLATTGTPGSNPWKLIQAVAAPTGDTLALARRI